jgi:hypothetical protein
MLAHSDQEESHSKCLNTPINSNNTACARGRAGLGRENLDATPLDTPVLTIERPAGSSKSCEPPAKVAAVVYSSTLKVVLGQRRDLCAARATRGNINVSMI